MVDTVQWHQKVITTATLVYTCSEIAFGFRLASHLQFSPLCKILRYFQFKYHIHENYDFTFSMSSI